MLKTNSKQAREALKNYIINGYGGSDYDAGTPEAEAVTLEQKAAIILADVKRVKGYRVEQSRGRFTWQDAFIDWAQGLPGLLDCDYYYFYSSAADILGDILQETDAEKAKYTEQQAADLLSRLLYRELIKAAPHVLR